MGAAESHVSVSPSHYYEEVGREERQRKKEERKPPGDEGSGQLFEGYLRVLTKMLKVPKSNVAFRSL